MAAAAGNEIRAELGNCWPNSSPVPEEFSLSLGVTSQELCAQQGCTWPILTSFSQLCREKGNTPWNTPNTTPVQPALRRKSSTNTWKQRGDFLPKRAKPRADGIPLEPTEQFVPVFSNSSLFQAMEAAQAGWVRWAPVGFGLGILT